MDADTLRIILIVCGGLVLAGHYYWERRREARAADEFFEGEVPDDKREPRLWGGSAEDEDDDEMDEDGSIDEGVLFRPIGAPLAVDESDTDAAPALLERPPQPLLLQLSVVAPAGTRFDGPGIVRATGRCGLEPGEMDIFHRYQGAASGGEVLFSVANLVKPGTFPFGAMADFESPGLSLFAEIRGEPEDPQLLDEMLEIAQCLARELKGMVLDDRRHRMSRDGENRLRQRVLALTSARSGLREQA
jgi:cell division protein ZipA